MTVLVVAPSDGGVAHVASRVAQEWRTRGTDAIALSVAASGHVRCDRNESQRHLRDGFGSVAWRVIREVVRHRACCVARSDRVHVELGRTSGAAFWFALVVAVVWRRLPVVVVAHDVPVVVKHPAALLVSRRSTFGSRVAYRVAAPLFDRPLLALLRRSCDVTVVLTDRARTVAEAAGWPRVTRAIHGADPAPADPVSPADATTVVLAGYLGPGKGLDVLADAWAQVGDCAPDLTLTIVGAPASRDDQVWVRSVAARLDAGARPPVWLGHVGDEEFTRAIDSCAVLVLPYEQSNPASGPLVRALVAGRAVVATRVPAVVDEIVDGHSGLLCEPGDASALAARLRQMMSDPALRSRLGDAAAERGRCHTWKAHVDVLSAVHGTERTPSGADNAVLAGGGW